MSGRHAPASPTLLLTRDELHALSGCQRRANVTAWLVTNGWAHVLGVDRWPRVSRAYAEAKLAGGDAIAPRASGGPNFDALRKAG